MVAHVVRFMRYFMFSAKWWHIIILIGIGYALGYWMPQAGNATIGKLYPKG